MRSGETKKKRLLSVVNTVPERKLRYSARKPRCGSGVLKSRPPPSSRAPVFREVTVAEKRGSGSKVICARPPPTLAQGATGIIGSETFTLTPGVKNSADPSRVNGGAKAKTDSGSAFTLG